MRRVKKIEIQESARELMQLMREEKRPLVQARLQALYLYKSGQDYTAISHQVGYERHTVGRWLSLYSQKGLAACQALEMGKRTGSLIGGQALAELQQKFN